MKESYTKKKLWKACEKEAGSNMKNLSKFFIFFCSVYSIYGIDIQSDNHVLHNFSKILNISYFNEESQFYGGIKFLYIGNDIYACEGINPDKFSLSTIDHQCKLYYFNKNKYLTKIYRINKDSNSRELIFDYTYDVQGKLLESLMITTCFEFKVEHAPDKRHCYIKNSYQYDNGKIIYKNETFVPEGRDSHKYFYFYDSNNNLKNIKLFKIEKKNMVELMIWDYEIYLDGRTSGIKTYSQRTDSPSKHGKKTLTEYRKFSYDDGKKTITEKRFDYDKDGRERLDMLLIYQYEGLLVGVSPRPGLFNGIILN